MPAPRARRNPLGLRPRLTRICATIGPATSPPRVIAALIAAGMDIARLNFSHGDVAGHARVVRAIRAAARRAGRPIAVLQDLQGPRVRVGRLGAAVELREGQRVLLGSAGARDAGPRALAALPLTYGRLHQDVAAGERILLQDGALELRVLSSAARGVSCLVERGGTVTSGAGLNAPDARLRVPLFTARDRRHLLAGAALGVDAVALSFVQDAGDVRRARRLLRRASSSALVIAKIERRPALDHLDAILAEADGVIVARGDLGVECPVESVPLLQKDIVRRAARAGAFVMIATHMLESMIERAVPTRAEVSDVANAVLDGVGAVMLSGETAHGRFPVQAVAAMDRIACAAERGAAAVRPGPRPGPEADLTVALCRSAQELAERCGARALVLSGARGREAQLLAAARPGAPILALAASERHARALTFLRGVVARAPRAGRKDRGEGALRAFCSAGLLAPGEVVVEVGAREPEGAGAAILRLGRVPG
ncbi:MAG: pyruvate kinase [Planctomycetes bacterium]|nr:pyruvate kinase [Planctomycetota bacterium]